MRCPRCGSRSRVIDSRVVDDGSVRRKRVCETCRHICITTETITNNNTSNNSNNKVTYIAKRLCDGKEITGETLLRYKNKCYIVTRLLSITSNQTPPQKGVVELVRVDPDTVVIKQ
mgnify:CR=1 FL=1